MVGRFGKAPGHFQGLLVFPSATGGDPRLDGRFLNGDFGWSSWHGRLSFSPAFQAAANRVITLGIRERENTISFAEPKRHALNSVVVCANGKGLARDTRCHGRRGACFGW